MIRKLLSSILSSALILGCVGPVPEPVVITIADDQIICENCTGEEGFGSSVSSDANNLIVKENAILHIFDDNQGEVTSIGTIGYDNGVRVLDIFLRSDTLIYGLEETDGTASAYIFVREGAQWELQQRLRSEVVGDGYGTSIDMDNNTLVISAPSNAGGSGGGTVYVYEKSENLWQFSATIDSNEPRINDGFGSSLATFNNFIYSGSTNTPIQIFENNGSGWQLRSTLDLFGGKMERWEDQVLLAAVDGTSLGVTSLKLVESGDVSENSIDINFPKAIASEGDIFDLHGSTAVISLQGGDEAIEMELNGTEWSFVQELNSNSGERCDFHGVAVSEDRKYLGGFDFTSNDRTGSTIWRVYFR